MNEYEKALYNLTCADEDWVNLHREDFYKLMELIDEDIYEEE
jgi:hypothetical protein